jgi:hypothetical protein
MILETRPVIQCPQGRGLAPDALLHFKIAFPKEFLLKKKKKITEAHYDPPGTRTQLRITNANVSE